MHQAGQKSTFVSVVAWIFIVLSGFGTLIGILQSVMVLTVFNTPEVAQAMQAPPPPGAPAFATFMMKYMVAFFVCMLALNAVTLVSSIGLLLRHNWARLVFVGLMIFGVVWNLAGLVLQFFMFSSMREQFAAVPDAPDMGAFFVGVAVVSTVLTLAFSVLFGWIAKRLMSPPLVAEFVR
ncbi:hypothetical protein QLQ15_06475 [Lysobacter sp. LF1]|uniref:DUF2975 domain-containing protein n=1 Tax=Lysobacter stagni TaxID=3045172 RepID=A0ABT6XEJ9_9GAMM|nr:hypothetical protein [Lysobacter sp. LF1]MDI9238558.1 hypothetical protein [Lysobacter sp. LF1]